MLNMRMQRLLDLYKKDIEAKYGWKDFYASEDFLNNVINEIIAERQQKIIDKHLIPC